MRTNNQLRKVVVKETPMGTQDIESRFYSDSDDDDSDIDLADTNCVAYDVEVKWTAPVIASRGCMTVDLNKIFVCLQRTYVIVVLDTDGQLLKNINYEHPNPRSIAISNDSNFIIVDSEIIYILSKQGTFISSFEKRNVEKAVFDTTTSDIIAYDYFHIKRIRMNGELVDSWEPPLRILAVSLDSKKRILYMMNCKGVSQYSY